MISIDSLAVMAECLLAILTEEFHLDIFMLVTSLILLFLLLFRHTLLLQEVKVSRLDEPIDRQ